MIDQVIDETVVILYPEALCSRQATAALRRLMLYYGSKFTAPYWARLVSTSVWRENRPKLIRQVAEQDWLAETDALTALQFAELTVLAAEACAGQWDPEQCRISVVRIDGQLRLSLVCNMEGFTT